ncbi:hypothetical protein D3C72_1942250 [compost metagenome]
MNFTVVGCNLHRVFTRRWFFKEIHLLLEGLRVSVTVERRVNCQICLWSLHEIVFLTNLYAHGTIHAPLQRDNRTCQNHQDTNMCKYEGCMTFFPRPTINHHANQIHSENSHDCVHVPSVIDEFLCGIGIVFCFNESANSSNCSNCNDSENGQLQ